MLAWSLFNVERSEERTRLSNLAYGKLKVKDYPKEALHRDLDLFCAGLWDYQLTLFVPELMRGEENQDPPSFYLKPYILEGGGTILFSPPGRGKSFTALLWAVSVNSGISRFWQVQKGPVLFVNLERSAKSARRRLANTNKVLGLPVNTPLLTLNARGKSLLEVAPIIRQAVRQHKVKLLVLDSISRAGLGDLNENRPVNAIIDTLSSLCESWLALGHTPRSSEGHLFGSVMADAGADIIVQLKSQQAPNKLGLSWEITKSNDLPQIPAENFALDFEDWNLTGARPAKPFEFPDLILKQKGNLLDDVKNFIMQQEDAEATASQIAESLKLNRSAVSNLLNQSGQFVKTRKANRSQFFGVAELT